MAATMTASTAAGIATARHRERRQRLRSALNELLEVRYIIRIALRRVRWAPPPFGEVIRVMPDIWIEMGMVSDASSGNAFIVATFGGLRT